MPKFLFPRERVKHDSAFFNKLTAKVLANISHNKTEASSSQEPTPQNVAKRTPFHLDKAESCLVKDDIDATTSFPDISISSSSSSLIDHDTPFQENTTASQCNNSQVPSTFTHVSQASYISEYHSRPSSSALSVTIKHSMCSPATCVSHNLSNMIHSSLLFEHSADTNGDPFIAVLVPNESQSETNEISMLSEAPADDALFDDINLHVPLAIAKSPSSSPNSTDVALPFSNPLDPTQPSNTQINPDSLSPPTTPELTQSSLIQTPPSPHPIDRLPSLSLDVIIDCFNPNGFSAHIGKMAVQLQANPLTIDDSQSNSNDTIPSALSFHHSSAFRRHIFRVAARDNGAPPFEPHFDSPTSSISITAALTNNPTLACLLGLSARVPRSPQIHSISSDQIGCDIECPYFNGSYSSTKQLLIDQVFIIIAPLFRQFFHHNDSLIHNTYSQLDQTSPLLCPNLIDLFCSIHNYVPVVIDPSTRRTTGSNSSLFFQTGYICTISGYPLFTFETDDATTPFSIPFSSSKYITPQSPIIPFRHFHRFYRFPIDRLHIHIAKPVTSPDELSPIPKSYCYLFQQSDTHSSMTSPVPMPSIGSFVCVSFSREVFTDLHSSLTNTPSVSIPQRQSDNLSISSRKNHSESDSTDSCVRSSLSDSEDSSQIDFYKTLANRRLPQRKNTKRSKHRNTPHNKSKKSNQNLSRQHRPPPLAHTPTTSSTDTSSLHDYRVGIVLNYCAAPRQSFLTSSPNDPSSLDSLFVLWVRLDSPLHHNSSSPTTRTDSHLRIPSLSFVSSQTENFVPLWAATVIPDDVLMNWLRTGHLNLSQSSNTYPSPQESSLYIPHIIDFDRGSSAYTSTLIPKPSLSTLFRNLKPYQQNSAHTPQNTHRNQTHFGNIDLSSLINTTPSPEHPSLALLHLFADIPPPLLNCVVFDSIMKHPASQFVSSVPLFQTVCFSPILLLLS